MLNWNRWTIVFVVFADGRELSIDGWNGHVAYSDTFSNTLKEAVA